MSKHVKRSIFALLVFLANFGLNFLIFTYSYNKLSTPYLNEEQRVDNAGYIMSGTLSMYLISALTVAILYFVISKRNP